jgi:hydrogenase/urease accessory protein HupE
MASVSHSHVPFGYLIVFVMVLGLLLAFAARLPWATIGLTAPLPLLVHR